MRGVIFLLVFSFFLTFPSAVLAHDDGTEHPHEETSLELTTPEMVSEFSTPSAKESKVNYELAYPGILPDHPLYFLKMIRDNVIKMLINDSIKMAEFNLLNSEKRMYATKLLVEKDKDELAYETLTKSNNYLHEALVELEKKRSQDPKNLEIHNFASRLKTVAQKNQEILENIKGSFDRSFEDSLEKERERMSNVEDSANAIANPKK